MRRYSTIYTTRTHETQCEQGQAATHLFLTNLAFTLLDDLDQILLDRLLERARDLVGTLKLLAIDGGHCGCEVVIVIEAELISRLYDEFDVLLDDVDRNRGRERYESQKLVWM
jgi:hypothetical protein